MSSIENFINECPSHTNLTDSKLFRKIEACAENLHANELDQLDLQLSESKLTTYNAVLAVKLAKSKIAISQLNKNIHITFLFGLLIPVLPLQSVIR